ncbi:MAG: hypothetical protein HKN17_08615, partial [Rhodothermales bacterium]|nr:hypothetical protein [Rhodothermales bacterium]
MPRRDQGIDFVELPNGIFTADGVWYHTSEALIEEFAAGVLEKRPLGTLLADATVWLNVPVTATAWLLPIYLSAVEPTMAALAGLVTWVFLALITPFAVFPTFVPAVRWMSHPIGQGLFYVLMLSYFAAADQFAAVGIGIAGFVLLRWGLVDRLLQPAVRRLPTPGPDLPRPDQVLRNLIVRSALKHRVDMPEVSRMENRIL